MREGVGKIGRVKFERINLISIASFRRPSERGYRYIFNNMKYQTILFDFDGVLYYDYFYSNLKKSHPKISKFIDKKVFGKIRKVFESRDGETFPYENYEKFELWMKECY